MSASPTVVSVKDVWAKAEPVFQEPCVVGDDCSPHLTEIVNAAEDVRKAMNADPAGAAFFSEAYTMIDRLVELRDNYHPLDDVRDELLPLADKLAAWINTHPTS